MRRIVTALIVTIGVLAASSTASAYELRGFDPRDREGSGTDPDVRSTILRVEPGAHGGRYLTVVIRAYEEFSVWWGMGVKLDAQDGQRAADHILGLYNADISAEPGAGCYVHPAGERGQQRFVAFRQRGKTVRCRLPIRLVQPDHQIRWRIVSGSWGDGILERAPNTGWYG